ncbi:deoxycytidine triphosphate deaminase [Candidatus Saccharibacteria bacterium]|nr:deoxycytidine triphosphate deaminase [Candidatus Saccharibacteria bacterium]
MSVFSNTELHEAIKEGHIVFHPYNAKHINGSSIDVTLGEWYFRTDRRSRHDIYNPFNEAEVNKYFSAAQRAIPHHEWCEDAGIKLLKNIPKKQLIIVLEPGERILAHTHEFIGIKAPGTSSMQSRSTWGRNGLAVCFDAGWGDPGYINRWTMEIYNLNQHHRIVLPVGERIAQVVFYHTGEVKGEYSNLSGKYQTTSETDIEKLVAAWEPEDMLPRAYRDKREQPIELKKPKNKQYKYGFAVHEESDRHGSPQD